MPENGVILQFKNVTIESEESRGSALWNIHFALPAGGLVLVHLEQGRVQLPLADAAEGLAEPAEGSVAFLGQDWCRMSADRAAAHRGRIGRVFEVSGWITGLTVGENVTLAQRHHSRRSATEIEEDASKLARMFGLPGLPRGFPSDLRLPDLRRASFVRAFLGEPVLVILERPTRDIFPDILSPLINMVRAVRDRGGAILWTTTDTRVWNEKGIRATARYRMTGSQLIAMSEGP